ncbi:MAG: C25 family cysteine peptidase [candidate division WOR-3 bacterium]|nr:C25 family cysteine peptidase [candidate division WOR-3 bacterium]
MLTLLFNLSFYYNEQNIKKLPILFEEGYPQIPYDYRLIEIPENAKNIKIKNTYYQKSLYQSNAILKYNDKIYYFDRTGALKTIDIPRINIGNRFPKSPIEIRSIGYFREKKYVLVFIYPIVYENGNLYLNEVISFDIEYEEEQRNYSIRPLPDSLDYAILTISLLKEPFDSIAHLSRIRGFRTEVFLVDTIKENPEKIRNFIIELYRTFGIKYLLIGADASIVKPWRFQVSFYDADQSLLTGPDVHTDYPYSALDGNYINGKKWKMGDSVIDPFADIGIGRLPVINTYEVFNYYRKLKDWTFNFQGNTNSFACLESEIALNYFGNYCEHIVLASNLPKITRLYEPFFNGQLTPQILFDSLNTNKPQFFFYIGHANGFYIASSYANPTYYVGIQDFYNASLNYSAPYIAMFGGCWTGDLEHTALVKNILTMPERGSIFSIGASKLDNTGSETARGMNFFYAFNSYNAKTIGDAYLHMVMGFAGSLFGVYSKLNMFGDPTIEPYFNGKNYISANHDNSFSDSLIINTIPNARVLLYDGELYVYTKSNNSGKAILRYNSNQAKTLLLSISKPSHIPYYTYVNYYPSEVILDSISLNSNSVIPGNTYELKFYLSNISSNNINVNFKVKFNNAIPDSIVQNLDFSPQESQIISSTITIKPDAKNLLVSIFINNNLIKRFSYIVQKPEIKLVGVKWENDSIALDIYNKSNINIYNIELKFLSSNVSKTLDSISAKSNTSYTTKLPRISNNPKLVISYAGKQDTYNLNYQLPLNPPQFYLFPRREGIYITFDTLDNSSRFYKIYRAKSPNGEYKFIDITNELSKLHMDYVDSFEFYYYKISSLDFYYNEGYISNYKSQIKSPNYSIYRPTYLPQQGEVPPIIGKFNSLEQNKQVLVFSPIYASFYNHQGINLNDYPKELKFRALSSALSDIDGDGINEAIVSAQKDGKSFLLLVKLDKIDTIFISNYWGDVSIYNKGLVIANFIGDTLPEIALKTYYSDGNNYKQRIIIIDPRTESIVNEFKYFKGNVSANWDICASDFDYDKMYEVVFLDSMGFLHIKKTNGQSINNFPIDIKPYLPSSNIDNLGQFSCAIDAKNNKIILGSTMSGTLNIILINVNSGMVEMVQSINQFINNNPIDNFALSLGDLDNNQIPEIILITNHNYYHSKYILIIKQNGSLLTKFTGPEKDWVWYSPASIVDIWNDNKIELVISLPRRVFILTYQDSLFHNFGSPILLADDTLPEGYPYYSPIFEDIDNNNKVEMFVMQLSNPLYSFDLGIAGKIQWNGNRANPLNTAEWGKREYTTVEEKLSNYVKFNSKLFAIEYNLIRTENYVLRIYDISGREVYEDKGNIEGKGVLELRKLKLKTGIYIVDFHSDNYKLRTKALNLGL